MNTSWKPTVHAKTGEQRASIHAVIDHNILFGSLEKEQVLSARVSAYRIAMHELNSRPERRVAARQRRQREVDGC